MRATTLLNIDSHQHYWRLNQFDYAWLSPENATLYQDRLPEHLRPQMNAAGIDRAVIIQAAATPEEIPWMLALCDEHPYLAGVVGFVDLTTRHVLAALQGFTRHPAFKGVRVNLPFHPGKRQAMDTGLRALASCRLSCDLLVRSSAMTQAIDLIVSHPDVTFIIDHMAGTPITLGGDSQFEQAIQPLARCTNTYMKVSGYMTAAGNVPRVSLAQTLRDYVVASLNVLGPGRLMFGSDWPVCTQAGEYHDAVKILRDATASLNTDEQEAIWSGTAARAYQLT